MKLSQYPMTIIRNIPQDHSLVTDSQDCEAIRQDLGESAQGYDSFFVKQNDGEYVSVYAFCGTVPYLSKLCSKIL